MSLKNKPTLKYSSIKVAVTFGDPSGIGPAVIAKSLNSICKLAQVTVIGDAWVFDKVQSTEYRVQSVKFIDLDNVNHKNFSFGKVKGEYGRASIEYLDKAMSLIKTKQVDSIVTGPISKEAISLAGFDYSGHTEYFSHKAKTKDTVMMLLNNQLKFSLVTRHIPIKDVSSMLTKEKLYKTIYLTHSALRRFFSMPNPRIVVCGLNPHASDNGLIGKEEHLVMNPVLRNLRKFIKCLDGPLSADIAIQKAKEKKYDCIIAIYHDQALIPLKLSGGSSGVNLTLGLPFIRTSPLHGTAFDIAGRLNLINPASFLKAFKLAVACSINQKNT
ncbi:MAG: 4-hydroxythreonine-4-phosphate dehydrogenase PdxA [Omnitrophica WOR_2 bacterium RBG_13_41_10]|nr:MAG: 4-hydroxythreonine-4-phosphate dehydrogenase PdxA [Omnitrophica WOR_2 bacterium RBG_13_41_10]